jgi:hypothetical protein
MSETRKLAAILVADIVDPYPIAISGVPAIMETAGPAAFGVTSDLLAGRAGNPAKQHRCGKSVES